MGLFFELEITYIIIGLFFLAVTLFVTTRDFMPKVALKRGIIGVSLIFAIMISFHYMMTTKRMAGVSEFFNEGHEIICENKMRRTISQSVILSKKLGWKLEGNYFKNPEYERDFFTARCIDYASMASKNEKK